MRTGEDLLAPSGRIRSDNGREPVSEQGEPLIIRYTYECRRHLILLLAQRIKAILSAVGIPVQAVFQKAHTVLTSAPIQAREDAIDVIAMLLLVIEDYGPKDLDQDVCKLLQVSIDDVRQRMSRWLPAWLAFVREQNSYRSELK